MTGKPYARSRASQDRYRRMKAIMLFCAVIPATHRPSGLRDDAGMTSTALSRPTNSLLSHRQRAAIVRGNGQIGMVPGPAGSPASGLRARTAGLHQLGSDTPYGPLLLIWI